MPLYEYECDACGHRFEVIQKFSDAPIETCAKCGGTVRKLLSSPAIQFKGSGWYITDYARAGKPESATTPPSKADAASSSESKSESASDTKTDTKAETKSDTKPAPPSTS
jgi:putative FmdB family regulatory protein